MKNHHSKWTALLGAAAIIGIAGCADRNKNDIPESPATSSEINKAVDKAGDVVENAAGTAAKVGKNLDDAVVITPKIKAAFAKNPSLKARNIDVDTTDKAVTLSGLVANAAQKTLAGKIAAQNAPGYKIVNNLKVAPAKKAG